MNGKRKVALGLIGFGTVGEGVVKMFNKHLAQIKRRVGADCYIRTICDIKIKEKKTKLSLKGFKLTTSYKDVINDPDIDIVVELIGGYEPARSIVLEAIDKGKHIVTANKAILAKYWDEIFTKGRNRKKLVYFEASVGGGIPVLQAINEGLAGNHITKIMGILNGTTNFILSRMTDNDVDFKTALKMAKSSGFAEADPSFDIEGIDARHKLAILASLAFGAWIRIEDIYCEGISNIQLQDIEYAKNHLGLVLKLIGVAKELKGELELRVHPALVSMQHPFAAVKDEYNAIQICGDSVGDIILYGKGAGQMAAASAVVSDIIFLSRQIANGTAGQLPYVVYHKNKRYKCIPNKRFNHCYYLRFTTLDKPGVLAKITGILGNNKVSIASVYQKGFSIGKLAVPILIVTHKTDEGKIIKSLKEIDALSNVKAKSIYLRIEG
ncbi:MAG: homoserine dehydrogenase [bacterium]